MLVAHRGFRTAKGENRLVDFQNALKFAKGCEFDIRLTKDKKIIIFHDHHFKRIGKVNKTVRSMTYKEILDIPFFKKNKEYIPPLFIEDFIEKISSEYKFINVEIKPSRYTEDEYKILMESLEVLRKKTKAEIVVSSFGKSELNYISKLDSSKYKKGYLAERLSDVDFELIKKFDYFHPYVGSLKQKKAIAIIDRINLPLNVWTFKKNEDSKKLYEMYGDKIYGYISDISDLVIYK